MKQFQRKNLIAAMLVVMGATPFVACGVITPAPKSSVVVVDAGSADVQTNQDIGVSQDHGQVGTDATDTGIDTQQPSHIPCGGSCDDGNPCTVDLCDAGLNACTHLVPAGATCDDGNLCTDSDLCGSNGKCVGKAKECGDNNACTSDLCISGECLNLPNIVTCDDADACTENDSCDNGKCAGTTVSCEDNNACTTESCDSKVGCESNPASCDDGNPCTTDSCDAKTGTCSHPFMVCDDNKAYTVDVCDKEGLLGPVGACVFLDKWNACTKDTDCADGNICTVDVCDSIAGSCANVWMQCWDDNPCTYDSCVAASGCVNDEVVCNDNNVNTADSCNKNTGACTFKPIPPAICVGGCNDNNVNTTDTCNNGVCVHTPVGTPTPGFVCPGGFGFTAVGAGCKSATYWGINPGEVMHTLTESQLAAGVQSSATGDCSVTLQGCTDTSKVSGAGVYNSPWAHLGCNLAKGGFGFAFDGVCGP